MGRGDKRTRRGKIFKGSYGNTRSQQTKRITKSTAKPSAGAAKGVVAKKSPASKKSK